MYEKEAVDQEDKVKRMESEGKDEYDIKKQVCCHFYKTVSEFLVLLNFPFS